MVKSCTCFPNMYKTCLFLIMFARKVEDAFKYYEILNMSDAQTALFPTLFDPKIPYNDLPRLPPPSEIESRATLKACIGARAQLATLKETVMSKLSKKSSSNVRNRNDPCLAQTNQANVKCCKPLRKANLLTHFPAALETGYAARYSYLCERSAMPRQTQYS